MKLDLTPFFFLTILAAASVTVQASDYTHYLAHGKIKVVLDSKGRPKAFPGGHDEKYFAEDENGNLFKLRLKNPAPGYAEVGVSILLEAMGLPTLPVYPILLKRGLGGVPTMEMAQKLDPHRSFALAGANGDWFPATLQPTAKLGRADRRTLNTEQLAEYAAELALCYVVGNRDQIHFEDGGIGNIGFINDHIVMLDATQAFKHYPDEGGDMLFGYQFMSHFPLGNITRLSETERKDFARMLNAFVTRLELISLESMKVIFSPYVKSMDSLRAYKEQEPFDYFAELNARTKTLRGSLLEYFRGQVEVTEELIRPVSLPAPHIRIPKSAMVLRDVPNLDKVSPVDALWWFYFQDFWKIRLIAAEQWSFAGLGAGFREPVATLIEKAAASDPNIYFVADHLRPYDPRTSISHRPQLHLNALNSETAVIVPVNDREAETIAEMASEAGAKVTEVDVGHGTKLDEALALQIIEDAIELQCRRVALVEFPGETPEVERLFEKAGLELLVIDHHKYRDIDRYKRLSSLEQAAELLSYDVDAEQKMIGVNDRAFIHGLADLGVDRETALKFASDNRPASEERPPTELEVALKAAKPVQTAYGPLYVLHDLPAKIGTIAGILTLELYPTIPNVLVLGRDIRFSGKVDLVKKLEDAVRPFEGQLGAHYQGGDVHRSMYWGVKGMSPETLELVSKAAEKAVAAVDCEALLL